MATGTMAKPDVQLQHDIQDELTWEPGINATDIGVIVKNGIVTLTGFVDSLYQKRMAEQAVKRVAGVKAFVDELDVKLATSGQPIDADIPQPPVHALPLPLSV